jgi:hypothetical protein
VVVADLVNIVDVADPDGNEVSFVKDVSTPTGPNGTATY